MLLFPAQVGVSVDFLQLLLNVFRQLREARRWRDFVKNFGWEGGHDLVDLLVFLSESERIIVVDGFQLGDDVRWEDGLQLGRQWGLNNMKLILI